MDDDEEEEAANVNWDRAAAEQMYMGTRTTLNELYETQQELVEAGAMDTD